MLQRRVIGIMKSRNAELRSQVSLLQSSHGHKASATPLRSARSSADELEQLVAAVVRQCLRVSVCVCVRKRLPRSAWATHSAVCVWD